MPKANAQFHSTAYSKQQKDFAKGATSLLWLCAYFGVPFVLTYVYATQFYTNVGQSDLNSGYLKGLHLGNKTAWQNYNNGTYTELSKPKLSSDDLYPQPLQGIMAGAMIGGTLCGLPLAIAFIMIIQRLTTAQVDPKKEPNWKFIFKALGIAAGISAFSVAMTALVQLDTLPADVNIKAKCMNAGTSVGSVDQNNFLCTTFLPPSNCTMTNNTALADLKQMAFDISKSFTLMSNTQIGWNTLGFALGITALGIPTTFYVMMAAYAVYHRLGRFMAPEKFNPDLVIDPASTALISAKPSANA